LNVELTAPAGNLEKGKFAIHYGADSVYMGYPGFSLRSGAEQFNTTHLEEMISFAHDKDKKLYFAINIFPHNKHIEAFKKTLDEIETLKPDGLILSDPGFLSMARERLPDMHLTVSTQANTTNYETIRFWEKSLNVNRVVLARELSIDEIKEIRDKTSVEIEVFVHGAVCMAYSGRCMLSGFMTSPEWDMTHQKFGSDRARHANLGDCIQPCRFRFALVEENRKDLLFPIREDQWGTYILSAKDLCLVDHLKELKNAGVDVFKIEGRMKSIYYVANVTRVYRKAIDRMEKGETLPEEDRQELYNISHRGYSPGFTFPEERSTEASFTGYQKSYRLHAIISDDTQSPLYSLKVFNSFSDNQTIEVIGPEMKTFVLNPGDFKLLNSEREPVSQVKHKSDGFLKTDYPLKKNDIVRLKFG
jgi:putative protease